MTIESFAQAFKLKITRDDCGDPIIEGTRGHLYFDGSSLCLMALNARLQGFNNQQAQALGGKCWIGDIWRDDRQRGYRDVKVTDIPESSWKGAIKLLRVRKRREATPEQLERLAQFKFRPSTHSDPGSIR